MPREVRLYSPIKLPHNVSLQPISELLVRIHHSVRQNSVYPARAFFLRLIQQKQCGSNFRDILSMPGSVANSVKISQIVSFEFNTTE